MLPKIMSNVARRRYMLLFLTALLAFNLALPVLAETDDYTPKPFSVVNTWINYDLRFRLARIVWDNINETIRSGKPFDLEKMKYEVLEPSIVAHLAFDRGAYLAGIGLKYAFTNVCPPFGLMVSSVVAEVVHGLGGAVGYEMSTDIKGDTNRRFAEVVGNAMKNVDVMGFIGMSMGSLIGSAVGQTLCAIPFVGAVGGGLVGAVIGGTITNYFVKTELGKVLAPRLQRTWNKGGDLLIAYSRWRAKKSPGETLWQKLKKNLRGKESLYKPRSSKKPPSPGVSSTPAAAPAPPQKRFKLPQKNENQSAFRIQYLRVGRKPSLQTLWDDTTRP